MHGEMIYIVPSRQRIQKIGELIESWDETRTLAYLLVAIDDDDPALEEYMSALNVLRRTRPWLHYGISSRKRMVGTLNHWARPAAHYYDVIGFMGDDHRPRTVGWDARVLETARHHVTYCNDLLQGSNLPTQVALPARYVTALGYMAPRELIHLYADNFWKRLGEATGITYLSDVIIEHMHPVAGKAEWDDVYKEVNAGELYSADRTSFEHYMATQFESDCLKVVV